MAAVQKHCYLRNESPSDLVEIHYFVTSIPLLLIGNSAREMNEVKCSKSSMHEGKRRA